MSIFVSVASFCDEHLIFTLRSLFAAAAEPDKIRVGVVDQSDKPLHEWLAQNDPERRIRYLHVDPFHSRGVCWARHLAASLYDDEDFYLQIDSHTCFVPGWDKTLRMHMQRLAAFSQQPLLTTYPPPFEFDADGKPKKTLRDSKSIYALEVIGDCTLTEQSPVLRFRVGHVSGGSYARGFHVAGGFLFAAGHFIREVPYDPQLYFHGEEQGIALRAFTRGWDIFHPRQDEIPLFHLYKRSGEQHRSHHWRADLEQLRAIKWTQRRQLATSRLQQMIFQNDLPAPYCLGSTRSLEDFRQLSGIDYHGLSIVRTTPTVLD